MLKIYTDGSCINNGSKHAHAGYSVVYPDKLDDSWGEPLESTQSQTNQTAELRAIYEGLKRGKTLMGPPSELQVRVYTDSEFSINCLTKWVQGWKKKNWVTSEGKPVVHKIVIENILNELKEYESYVFTHVKAHTGALDENSKWNQIADDLARKAVNDNKRVEFKDLKEPAPQRCQNEEYVLKGIPLALMSSPVSEQNLFDSLKQNLSSLDQAYLKSALFAALKKTLQSQKYDIDKTKIHKTMHYKLIEKSHLTVDHSVHVEDGHLGDAED